MKEKIDFQKVRDSKKEAMRKFKEAFDKALREGTIVYKKL